MPASSLRDPAEALLVARAVEGDREAFGDIYERHLTAVYRYIFYRVGEARLAEDLTESVFLKAWEALDRYRPSETPFKGWLYRIAHNLIVDAHRARRPEAPLTELHPDDRAEHDPEAHAAQRDQQRALTGALRQLEPLHQQVLALRFIGGLSHAETAQVVGRSEGAVRVIQHRAIAIMRRLLNGRLDEHD